MQNIAIVGLGYVGLPLAVAFAQKGYSVIGFDVNKSKIDSILALKTTDIIDPQVLFSALSSHLHVTDCSQDLKNVDVFIVTVPTPVDRFNVPDFTFLKSASEIIAHYLQKGNIVVYESTVYPGCTEEICLPILETSGLSLLRNDFGLGYSPERINPGDKNRPLSKIKKIVSGSDANVLATLSHLYATIIDAGIYEAHSIKVAEAAKVIENAQRDINISFMNELALIFDKMDIDTQDVLAAAGTKWNFLPFKPGLVGGHCISVDPYYLAYKSEQLGYIPEVILSGRRVNNRMGHFVAQKVLKLLSKQGHRLDACRVLILGFSFKENCADCRNTKVMDMYQEFVDFGVSVDICDPVVDKISVASNYQLSILDAANGLYNAVILAVAHKQFQRLEIDSLLVDNGVIFDVKSVLPRKQNTYRL